MSGRALPEMVAKSAPPAELTGLPVMVVHGTADQVLPVKFGRGIRDVLSRLPVDLTYREYPMGHEVNERSLSDINAWLSARL
jgi:phospholipase/carboxylesterase